MGDCAVVVDYPCQGHGCFVSAVEKWEQQMATAETSTKLFKSGMLITKYKQSKVYSWRGITKARGAK